MASTDPLTQLSNRREMSRILADISAESKNSGKSFVIGIGDIDNFKRVNDIYGHDLGDTVLSSVSGIIRENLPQNGFVSRWGGEEFLFVIPDADIDSGSAYAEKIIHSIKQHEFDGNGSTFFVTMTFGICEGKPDDIVDKIISHADSRLYKGKNGGKNCVMYTD